MNYLSHLYLSGNNRDILIGNFIADAVKGNKFNNYPDGIKKGILLHRHIDTFTDTHPISKRSMKRLHPRYRHFKGVIMDIIYDHFLAKNWSDYCSTPLEVYAEKTYQFLQSKSSIFPERIIPVLTHMTNHNWLVTYKSVEGIEHVLNGMNSRTKGISQMNLAIEDLKENYNEFEQDFFEFFAELEQFNKTKTLELLSQ